MTAPDGPIREHMRHWATRLADGGPTDFDPIEDTAEDIYRSLRTFAVQYLELDATTAAVTALLAEARDFKGLQEWRPGLLERIDTALGLGPACTEVTASWCPVHGDCTCPDEHEPTDAGYGIKDLDDPHCPLHSPTSDHPIR